MLIEHRVRSRCLWQEVPVLSLSARLRYYDPTDRRSAIEQSGDVRRSKTTHRSPCNNSRLSINTLPLSIHLITSPVKSSKSSFNIRTPFAITSSSVKWYVEVLGSRVPRAFAVSMDEKVSADVTLIGSSMVEAVDLDGHSCLTGMGSSIGEEGW